jgi:hypothetical protein
MLPIDVYGLPDRGVALKELAGLPDQLQLNVLKGSQLFSRIGRGDVSPNFAFSWPLQSLGNRGYISCSTVVTQGRRHESKAQYGIFSGMGLSDLGFGKNPRLSRCFHRLVLGENAVNQGLSGEIF